MKYCIQDVDIYTTCVSYVYWKNVEVTHPALINFLEGGWKKLVYISWLPQLFKVSGEKKNKKTFWMCQFSPGMATLYKCQAAGNVLAQDGIVGVIIRGQKRSRWNQGSASAGKSHVDKLSFTVFWLFIFSLAIKTKQTKKNVSTSQEDAFTFIETYSKCQEMANEGY